MTERWLDGIRRRLRNLHNALTGIADYTDGDGIRYFGTEVAERLERQK